MGQSKEQEGGSDIQTNRRDRLHSWKAKCKMFENDEKVNDEVFATNCDNRES
jgi:hypothetical protein